MQEEILKRIDALAEKLGTTGELLWGVLVRQAVMEGWGFTIALLVSFFICGAIVLMCFRPAMKELSDTRSDSPRGTASVFAAAFAAIGALIAGISLLANQPFLKILNPEYYAFLEIRKLF